MNMRLTFPLALLVSATVTTLPTSAQDAEHFRAPRPRDAWVTTSAQADEPPRLGVMVSEEDDGVLVSETIDGSLAANAGIAAGDILFKINGRRVEAIADIPEILSETSRPGSEVRLTVIREGEGLVTLSATREAPRLPEVRDDVITWVEDENAGGFLGIGLGDADGGALVSSVYPGTTAWFAGLEEGDVITRLAGEKVGSAQSLADRVGSLRAGRMITMAWSRDGETMKTRIRLGQREPEGLPLGMAPGGPENLFFGRVVPGDAPPPHPARLPMQIEGNVRRFFTTGEGGQIGLDLRSVPGSADGLHGWVEKLHEHMGAAAPHDGDHGSDHEIHLQLEGDQPMMIRIENGKVIIDKDGKTEIIEMGGGAEGASYHVISPGKVRVGHPPMAPDAPMPAVRMPAIRVPAIRVPAIQAAIAPVVPAPPTPSSEAAPSCEASAECEAVEACEEAAECEPSSCEPTECEAPAPEASADLT